MLSITQEFRFDAAHKLWRQDLSDEENRALYGRCADFHGHTFTLRITVSGPLDASGMIVDFIKLKRLVTVRILDLYDHANLNALPQFQTIPPTAENMALHIFKTLADAPELAGLTLNEVRVYEAPDAWAATTG